MKFLFIILTIPVMSCNVLAQQPVLSEKQVSSKNILPGRAEREQFFADNWKEGLKDFDELEKDLLYRDLKSKTILELRQKYPELSPKELEELQTKRK